MALVEMVYDRRDVPFSDRQGVVKDILVGICDACGEIVAIPPLSTEAIKAAYQAKC
jgi:hypothetical protein